MPTFLTSHPESAAELVAAAGRQRPHLILVGLPGSGKTRAGQAAAEKLGRRFLDFDAEIERRELVSISEIFAAKGEPHFRELERSITNEVRGTSNMVLAPGGGWIANPGCLELLRPPAILLYLKVEPEIAVSRMGRGTARRPLLRQGKPAAQLTDILKKREDLYLQSDHTISTDFLSYIQVAERIVALATA